MGCSLTLMGLSGESCGKSGIEKSLIKYLNCCGANPEWRSRHSGAARLSDQSTWEIRILYCICTKINLVLRKLRKLLEAGKLSGQTLSACITMFQVFMFIKEWGTVAKCNVL